MSKIKQIKQEEQKCIPKSYYDNALAAGIKIGPYRGKTRKEITKLGDVLYREFIKERGWHK